MEAAPLQAALTQSVQAILIEAWQASMGPAACGVCLLAAGGFGKGELFPFSDVDIAIVCEAKALSPRLKESLSQFLAMVRQHGIRPVHRLCSIEDCLELRESDLDLSIKLLDRRFIAGDDGFEARIERDLSSFFSRHSQRLSRHLCDLTRERHSRFHNTPFWLEPDVNQSPGGLPDARLIRQLAKLSPEQSGSVESLDEAAALVSAARCFLHYRAGDDSNLFDFVSQRELGQRLTVVEYYEAARKIFNSARRALDSFEKSTSLLDSFRLWQTRLSNNEFSVLRERVFLRKPADLGADPATALRLLEFVAQHGIPPAADTERRLESEAGAIAAHSTGPLWPGLKAILCLPHAALALRLLRDTRLLKTLLPEWDGLETLAGDDPDGRFTAGEHTLVAIERIAELREPADPLRQRFAELVSEVEDPPILLFALLFHAAPANAGAAARRARMPESGQDLVTFLVENQSLLTEAGTSRDLHDPVTLRQLADRIGTIERLKLLAALSYATTAALDPHAMTGFRLEQLWRTYALVQHELTQELETARIGNLPEDLPEYAGFLKGFPLRYLRSRSRAGIEADVRLHETSRPTGVAAAIERMESVYKMTIAARDAPFLFASFAGAISSFGLDILKAEAFSNSRGDILDTFVFSDPKRTLELNPPEMERLGDLIRRVALGKTEVRRLLRNPAKPESRKRAVIPEVRFDADTCETATLVEIIAEDRQGLLYNLAMVFSSHACNIDIVLIDTKGNRAIDVFYVAHGGKKLSPEMQTIIERKILEVC